jgi:UDP:flavonoid glycosyltransferase YjiC (YdhE family)
MAHLHLCWELGGGLGHAGRLKMLARALLARGHRVTMSLRDLAQTRALLADLDVPKFQAPIWQLGSAGLPPTQGNLAEILFLFGYLDAAPLSGMVDGWRALFGQLRPDLVVADFAPTALLAARAMGLRSASVGNGFYSPPPRKPLPPLRDWEQIPAQRLAAAEARVVSTANALLPASAQPVKYAAELFLGDCAVLCGWPELDHYGRAESEAAHWAGPSLLSHDGIAPRWPAGGGRKVFAYLKAGHPAHRAVLQALVDEGCRAVVYLAEVAGGAAPPVVSALLHYADGPVDLALALAEAELCVCHAGDATVAQTLLAGVPLLMLPMQNEQFLLARRVAVSGAGYNAALLPADGDWRGAVRRVLGQDSYRLAARAFASRHQGYDPVQKNDELAALLERQMASTQQS